MRCLVTGGAGFIGSHLVEALLAAGHEVLVLDNFSTGRVENLAGVEGHPCLQVVRDTVVDREVTAECVRGVDRVFHLASAVGVRLVVEEPVRTIETIVEGTATVLGACAEHGRPVLVTSTSEVYGKSEKVPFAEDDDSVIGPPTFRRWSYATCKSLGEFLALAHWHESRLPVIVVRLFNTIGPRQTGQYGMVVPRLAAQALAGEPLTVYGDGTQTRCFCHVADAVRAMIGLIDHPDALGGVFNVGTSEEVSINRLAEMVRSLAESRSEIQHVPFHDAFGSNFEDMDRRVPDLTKIAGLIGYRPERSLEETVCEVIQDVKDREIPT